MSEKKTTTEKKSGFKIVADTLKYFFPIAWKFKKSYFFLSVIHTILNAFQPFIDLILLPLIIDELITGKDVRLIVTYAAVMILGDIFIGILSSIFGVNLEKYDDLFQNFFSEEIGRRCMDMDFALTENKQALDQISKANEGIAWYSGGVGGITRAFFQIVSNVIKILGVIVLLIMYAPILLLITAVLLTISTILNNKKNKIEVEQYIEMSKINRIFGYYLFGISDFRYGKDIRLYGAAGMMLEKVSCQIKTMVDKWHNTANKRLPLDLIDVGNGAVRDTVTYCYVGWLAIKGAITIGVFSQMLTAASTFHFAVQGIIFGVQDIVKRCTYAYEYVKFMDSTSAKGGTLVNLPHMIKGNSAPNKNAKHVFEFRNVSFSYPNSEVEVLKNVSLTIPFGQHLSVVGLNGAGKSTFIKLLCRLYDTTGGEILLDGINIKDYDIDEYMKIFSVVFQDFRLFAFSAAENIDLGSEAERKKLEELCELVGISKKINSLEKGLDTMIFRQFDENGIEPSGGEQQKLAIARALYKNAPIVILDEPTAALDPIAEYDIYRQFDALVGGKTAVYISHRLSSCKFCDKIAVFSEETVKEYGTHDELVKLKDGVYAEMFAAQAQYYA